ncbi:MAG: CoB--CoM heterodisulfide reductase iron-sulfur subunit B family protein [Phycisphaerae bacterium]|nr:CoB--CoM heterodisulfide reductase iron-sulfur subunit B family protein [Phycisphaerae bacterium]
MRLGLYPGCSLLGSSREYAESLRAVAVQLGIEWQDVPDWNCCGASAAHSLNHDLALALPARILAQAEKAGIEELAVPCSACYSRLAITRHELLADETLRKKIVGIIEMDLECKPKVLNVLEILGRFSAGGLSDKVRHPFKRKVACYYGCYLVRPHKVLKFDRVEDPQSMDEIMKAVGADPIDWAYKTECCGAGFSVSRTDLVAKLSGKIVDDAVRRGAEAIVVACPMCHVNLDLRRGAIEKHKGRQYSIPVLYISQVVGLALGLDDQTLGMHRHIVPVVFSEPREAGCCCAGHGEAAAPVGATEDEH